MKTQVWKDWIYEYLALDGIKYVTWTGQAQVTTLLEIVSHLTALIYFSSSWLISDKEKHHYNIV